MTARFPDLPIYAGFNAPSRAEIDLFDLEVEGDLPAGLEGTFYRVGPDPARPPRLPTDIYFNGDGMVSMFRFAGGHVDFKCRYVRTDKYLAERRARQALFGAYRNPFTDDPAVAGIDRTTANTNVVPHAGVLLAMKEDGHPFAMDLDSLETIGRWDFHGTMTGNTWTAHPKLDPLTGEMIGFGYSAKGEATPDIVYRTIGPDGKVGREVWFQTPYTSMIHDFGVTRNWVIFPICPIVSGIERLKAGLPHFGWDPSMDNYIGVLPRDGEAKDLRWFKGPAIWTTHVLNAFEDGTRLHIDLPCSEGNVFPFFPDVDGSPFDRARAAPRLMRWSVDLASNGDGFSREFLTDFVGDFPQVDRRYAMSPHRYGFLTGSEPGMPLDPRIASSAAGMFFNTISRLDVATGKRSSVFAGSVSAFQEPVFIPRSAAAPEGDGYLVCLVNRFLEGRNDLLVIDTADMEAGPRATIRLPIRLRNGLHGSWLPA